MDQKGRQRLNSRKWRAANLEKAQAQEKIRRERMPPEMRKHHRDKWRFANSEKVKENYRRWCKENPEKKRAGERAWKLANPHKDRAKKVRRELTQRQATPKWANRFYMDEAYALARLRTRVTGVLHHVDHRVPIKSDIVCGLHCEQNLQVIPGALNAAKGNRVWENMP